MELKAGYKVTDVGIIPNGWNVGTFGEVCRVNQGLQVAIEKRLKYQTQIAKLYITIQFLNDRKSIEYIETYPLSACCSYDDVLMTRTGNTGIVVSGVEGVFHNNFFKINFNKRVLDREYLISFLCLGSTRKTILMKAGTSTIPDLNHSDFYSISLPIPPVSEQRKIAIALADVDALIAGLEKLIAKKRDIKQAAMQQLLTGQTRLPGFSGDWMHKQLGDVICEISDGGTPSTSDSRNFGGDVPWVVIDDIQQKIAMTRTMLTEKGLQACAARRWPQGALIVSTGATIGEVGILHVSAATKQGICGIIFDPLLAKPEYMQYWFVNNKKLLLSKAQGSSIKEVRAPTLVTLSLSIPGIDEQTAIAGILDDMDSDISTCESRLAKTRELKQGMMQELLTGNTRLI